MNNLLFKIYIKQFFFIALIAFLFSNHVFAKNDIIPDIKSDNSYFIENKGQWDNSILFVNKSPGLNIIVKNNAVVYDYFSDEKTDASSILRKGHSVSLSFVNPQSNSIISGYEEQTPYYNYIRGAENSQQFMNCKTYKSIKFKNIYNGIDFVLYFDNFKPRYDFIVSPDADPSIIQYKLEGSEYVSLVNSNLITYNTRFGKISHSELFAFQNNKKQVKCSFKIDDEIISFKLGKYNKKEALTIDPLVFSTYWGASQQDSISGLAMRQYGEFVVCGWTLSDNFHTTPGAYDETYESDKDVFVSKFKVYESNNSLLFSTIIGTSGDEIATAAGVDVDKDIYVCGYTNSRLFPFLNGTGTGYVLENDLFLCKISSTGNTLIYSSILGGKKDDIPTDMKIPTDKSVYLCGYTGSDNFPLISGAYQNKIGGLQDIFVTKISSSGKTIDFSTFIGGTGDDRAYAIDLDESNNVYLTGCTKSGDFPMAPYAVWGTWVTDHPYDYSYNGNWDVVAIKLISEGSKLEISTYLGGTQDDIGLAVVAESDGTMYIAGETVKEGTKTFPSSDNAFSKTHNGGTDIFFAKMDKIKTSGSPPWTTKIQDLVFSTFLGGNGNENLGGMVRDNSTHSFYLTGRTTSSSFPIVNSQGAKYAGSGDVFITKFLSQGDNVSLSTLYGGKGDDNPSGIIIDSRYDFYIAGTTSSVDLPLYNCQIQNTYAGSGDGFIFKNATGNLKILVPGGKEELCPGSKIDLKWQGEDFQTSDSVKIEIKRVADTVWTILAPKVPGSAYTWNIPAGFPPANDYLIKVSNKSGIFTVLGIPFSILKTPEYIGISSEPENTNVCEGTDIKIHAKAIGSNIKYKWYKNDVLIENASDSVLNIPAITQSAAYKFVAIGTCNPQITSDLISFTVKAKTKILAQPKDTTIKKGLNIEFKVNAAGSSLQYEWYKDGSKIIFQEEPSLKFTNVNISQQGVYKCIITGDCGIDSTAAFKLTVDTTTQISVEDYFSLNENPYVSIVSHSSSSVSLMIKNSAGKSLNICLFDNLGRKINTLYNGMLSADKQNLELPIPSLSPGLYWITVNLGKEKFTLKFIY